MGLLLLQLLKVTEMNFFQGGKVKYLHLSGAGIMAGNVSTQGRAPEVKQNEARELCVEASVPAQGETVNTEPVR